MQPGVCPGWNTNRLCDQVAGQELFAVKSSKLLSCAGTAITHYTVDAKLVTSQEYARAYLEGTTKLCQLVSSPTHYLNLLQQSLYLGTHLKTSQMVLINICLSGDKNHRAVL